jgi:hypothetical protein
MPFRSRISAALAAGLSSWRNEPPKGPNPPAASTPETSTVLLDFDNFYPPAGPTITEDWFVHQANRIIQETIVAAPETTTINIRLYGGWLEDGVLTNRASSIQAAARKVGFPIVLPDGGLLRGSLELVTRLFALPSIEWAHTRRTRSGLPPLRLVDRPLPMDCAGDAMTCPLRFVHRFARRGAQQCHITGCTVRNRDAFELVEQKMVDSLICCDVIAYSRVTNMNVIVLSDDLDVVPALAMATVFGEARVHLIRTSARDGLYREHLTGVGVDLRHWEAA